MHLKIKDDFRISYLDLDLIKILIILLEENKEKYFFWIFDIFLNYYIIILNKEDENFSLNIKEYLLFLSISKSSVFLVKIFITVTIEHFS